MAMKRIPFDLKLWQEKGYAVETRNGEKISRLFCVPEENNSDSLIGMREHCTTWNSWRKSGKWTDLGGNHEFDLFLLVSEPEPEKNEKDELLELAWGIIANASGGDWIKESSEWRKAAAKWRDRYHAVIPNAGQAIEVPRVVATIPDSVPTLTPEEANHITEYLDSPQIRINRKYHNEMCTCIGCSIYRKLRVIAGRKETR